eukprot:6196248-Pleurochrysis_carterae.AAC.3
MASSIWLCSTLRCVLSSESIDRSGATRATGHGCSLQAFVKASIHPNLSMGVSAASRSISCTGARGAESSPHFPPPLTRT